MYHPDLFDYLADPPKPRVVAWQPNFLTVDDWRANDGPDYKAVFAWRLKTLKALREDKQLLRGAKAYYAKHSAEFIMHWMDTYDPRRPTGLKWMPFVLFERQYELLVFLDECVRDQENGLIEKARDMGATWLACGWSVHHWLFVPDFAIGFGSRKEDLVDQPGILDSIFEKIRALIRRVPDIFLPEGFNPTARDAMPFMRLMNPANGSTIAGESGDNIGRGGRKSIYFKDESAHYERPEKIEASLGDNTNVQIDMSSVNGLGNVFERRARAAVQWYRGGTFEKGQTRKFIMDWRDHPNKTDNWYETRKQRFINEGLEHVFAQEVDRNYAASVQNTIIPVEWIRAAVGAAEKLGILDKALEGGWGAGLDVADGGIDRNALALRKGIVLRNVVEWGARDPGVSTRMVLETLEDFPRVQLEYDSIGVGASVKSEYNRVCDVHRQAWKADPTNLALKKKFETLPVFNPWNAGAKVLNPRYHVIEDDDESPFNGDFFYNLKAQAWWSLRTKFWHTFQMINDPSIKYPVDQLISIDPTIKLLNQLIDELAQPTRGQSPSNLKMIINKQPDGTKSPNLADAVVMGYFPLPTDFAIAVMGSYGTE